MSRRGRGRDRNHAAPGQAEVLLGELEAAIMSHCWATAEAAGKLDGAPQTVADVHQALAAAGRRSAYTTIMTVMGRLVEKGLLRRSESIGRSGPGSSYRYWPAQRETDFIAAASQARVADLVATFGDVALAQFADALGALDPERLEALRRLGQGASDPQVNLTIRPEPGAGDQAAPKQAHRTSSSRHQPSQESGQESGQRSHDAGADAPHAPPREEHP